MTSTRFKPYPETKDSGIEWLGQIPEQWEHSALKRLGEIRYGLGEPPREDPDGIPFVRATDLHRGHIELAGIQHVDPEDVPWSRDPVLREDDIIVVRSGAYTGDSAIVPRELDGAVAGYDMFVRIRSADPRFVAWALLSAYVLKNQIDLLRLRAAQPHLNAEELGATRILTCPRGEQVAIADFLDRETAKIDALVEKKERLIELLQEKRTALITHAVTKGLDPEAPMKDSGIEWLGQIPTHWVETRLGWSVEVNGGHTPDTGELRYWDGEIPWVTPKDMKRRVITDSLDHVSEEALAETSLRLLATGNVLIVVRGMILAHTFPVAVLRAPATINQDMKALLPTDGLESDYLAYLLEGISEFILSLVEESAHGTRRLQTELWKRVQLFLPPAIEQARIIEHLDSEIAKIDALIAKVEEAIERLKEYRIALISAATTGKIDVRGL